MDLKEGGRREKRRQSRAGLGMDLAWGCLGRSLGLGLGFGLSLWDWSWAWAMVCGLSACFSILFESCSDLKLAPRSSGARAELEFYSQARLTSRVSQPGFPHRLGSSHFESSPVHARAWLEFI